MATAIPKIDSSKLYMLSKNYAEHVVPGVLCYLRFGDDKGGEYEIYVPPGREEEILRLNEQDDWEALLKFPPFSDQPPLTMRVNVAGYPLADGTYKMFHIPDDDAKHARMSELMEAQDYQSMEKEFEPWGEFHTPLPLQHPHR